jgi:hypothetical protein
LSGNGARKCSLVALPTKLALEAGISAAECRFTFGVTRAAMHRWAREPWIIGSSGAIRMRLAIEVRVAGSLSSTAHHAPL